MIVYTKPVIGMVGAGEFYYGGSEGFWKDTVKSLIETSLYGMDYFNLDALVMYLVAGISIVTLIAFSALFLSYKLLGKEELKLIDKYLLMILGVLFLGVISIMTQRVLFNTKYVIERSAIYFIPFFLLFAMILWGSVRSFPKKMVRVPANIFFYSASCLLLLHFLNCANLSYFLTWKIDSSTKDMIEHVVEIEGGKNLRKNAVRLGIDWVFEPSVNFYRMKNKLTWMKRVDRGGPDGYFDYYYLLPGSQQLIEKYNLEIIKKFNVSDTYLAAPAKR